MSKSKSGDTILIVEEWVRCQPPSATPTTPTLSGVMQPYGFSSTTYDNENRLTAWNRTDGNKNQSWVLSLVGDWNSFTEDGTTQNRTHSAVHSLNSVDSTTLAHDLKGNLTTNSNGQAYAWDFDNRMKSATVSGNTHGYAYDALGRRVAKTVSDGTNTVTTVFVSDGQQEIAEYVGGAAATSPSKKYLYADYVDEPLAMISGGNTYFYHQNNLYSVAALTDSTGNVVERYAYNAYGKPIICSGAGDVLTASSVGNPYLFTGRRLDTETGLQYSRARYYSFEMGRWLGRDPIGYRGGIDLYEYVGGRVLVAVDPTGMGALYDGFMCGMAASGAGITYTATVVACVACVGAAETAAPCIACFAGIPGTFLAIDKAVDLCKKAGNCENVRELEQWRKNLQQKIDKAKKWLGIP